MNYFKTVQKSLEQVDSVADSGLKMVFNSKMAQALLYLLIILYATKFAPALPRQVMDLVDNQFFKIFVFFMVIWSAKHSPTTALVISVAFLMTMNYINNVKMFEKMESELKEQVLQTELADMEPSSAPQAAQGEVVLPPVVVEPKIVTTSDGSQMVVTPQVVIASKEVTAPNGEKIVVTPEVTTLPPPASVQVPSEQAPVEVAVAPAAAQAEQAPVKVAVAPAAPVQAEGAVPPAAKATPYSEACFAMQSYDMSKVTGLESFGQVGYASV